MHNYGDVVALYAQQNHTSRKWERYCRRYRFKETNRFQRPFLAMRQCLKSNAKVGCCLSDKRSLCAALRMLRTYNAQR